jgi:hypothetical protein
VRNIVIGVIVGMLLGGPAAVQAYDKVQPKHDITGEGYYVDCTGNGKGGYRRCDLHIERGAVRRFDLNQYVNNQFEIGLTTWDHGAKGGGNGMGQYESKVVR